MDTEIMDWHLTNGVTENPQLAAKWLLDDRTVDYQPGDGTRYECRLTYSGVNNRKYLVVFNLNLTAWLRPGLQADLWARDPNGGKYIPGCWMGLRPLFAALGYANGGFELRALDQRDEADARARQHTWQPHDKNDADLGRAVRLMVQAQEVLDG